VKTTPYFENDVQRRRSFILTEWIELAIASPDFTDTQADGRKRFWKFIPELDKFLRVITLEDGETVLNAFPDRSFKPEKKK
jgi:hypothetical protein